MQYRLVLAASMAIAVNASPAPMPTEAPVYLMARQPASKGTSVLSAPMTIAAGESFDGGNVMYDRGVSCTGQQEGGDSDAVFILEKGASLSNVIIGPNQSEGVHCNGGCTITNVWWDKVCEDAFTIKKQDDGETTTINGGGATGAEDKVIQHNGGGTVNINNFEVSDFGKMYRSCGNCKSMPARHVVVTGGSASSGKVLVGINSNMGDTASISGVSMTNVKSECINYKGVTDGSEPSEVGPCSGTGGGSDSSATTSAAASTKSPSSTKTSADASTKTTTKSSTKTTKSSTKTSTKKSSTKTSTSSSSKATKGSKAFEFADSWA